MRLPLHQVDAFPNRGADPEPRSLRNGPGAKFLAEGFAVVVEDPGRPVLARVL